MDLLLSPLVFYFVLGPYSGGEASLHVNPLANEGKKLQLPYGRGYRVFLKSQ